MSGDQKYLRFEDDKLCLTFDYVNNEESLLFMSRLIVYVISMKFYHQ